ncbi:AMP-dependent synthetase [Dermacoccus sp. PE3]|uniref:AMP-binding protein n=1 Tax=Dermacoccus sp. PE3 TaxID=1641401 RepID=UPI00064235DD|nr:AMP-binding protein [Dermacoccus sp. PE3]KLO64131.1 AMP-dependent synthetase [Dermacoccus sp. PE3]
MTDLPLVSTTLSLASVLAEPAWRTPETVALVQGPRRLTYAETWNEARKVAAALVEDGVEPGDRVALLAPNVVEFVTSYYGILAAGGVVVPVPTLLQGREAAFLIATAGASRLLYHPAVASTANQGAELAGVPLHDITTYGAATEPLASFVTREPMDPAVIFFTSGTTGKPKGAVLTHLNLVMNATVSAFDGNGVADDAVILGCLPLFHIFGQSVSLNAGFRRSSTLVLQPRFEPREAIDLMNAEGVTMICAVPTMYIQLLAAVAENPDLKVPHLDDAISGGASLPVAVLERFEKTFSTRIHEGYGLSETSPSITSNQERFGVVPGSVGHPLWGVDVDIADLTVPERISLVGPGERGEVVVRGHAVFAGYWNNAEASAEALTDGWFRTGDIGIKDATGRITIVDRTKDLVIRGGYNVYPREVEEALMRYDGVAQVAVIGVPHEEYGEEIMAVVVPTEAGAVDADALVEWSRDELGKHKYPRRVQIVEQLPLGPSMKVLKRELRTQYSDNA